MATFALRQRISNSFMAKPLAARPNSSVMTHMMRITAAESFFLRFIALDARF